MAMLGTAAACKTLDSWWHFHCLQLHARRHERIARRHRRQCAERHLRQRCASRRRSSEAPPTWHSHPSRRHRCLARRCRRPKFGWRPNWKCSPALCVGRCPAAWRGDRGRREHALCTWGIVASGCRLRMPYGRSATPPRAAGACNQDTNMVEFRTWRDDKPPRWRKVPRRQQTGRRRPRPTPPMCFQRLGRPASQALEPTARLLSRATLSTRLETKGLALHLPQRQ
mmetsp:Transcript_119081/g.336816  ORF Transcript_119081/g.336816 Transcript_119081/m.336816 type:complete len:226 (+) Transcript_119081:178-855(+)